MTWQRHNGRLVRGSDNSARTLVALPQRTRRRRARPKPQPNRLTSLPDDIAKRVFAFVAPPARPAAALRVAATGSAVRSLVHRCCLEHLNTCTVDDVSHALELMRAYSRARAPLISLTVHLGSEELQMLRWLLETCDTTQLMRLRIVVPKNCPPFMNLLAHSLGRPSGPIDVDADTFRVPTMLDFNRIVAWRPDPAYRPVLRSLRSLALVGCGDEALAQMGSVLRHLVELQLTVPNRYRRGAKKYPALSRLTRLRYLALHGGADTPVEIHSPSLRVISTVEAAKGLYIRLADCPLLTDLRVRDCLYGNGIRRVYAPPREELERRRSWRHIARDALEMVKMDEDRDHILPPQELQDELDRLENLPDEERPGEYAHDALVYAARRRIEEYCDNIVVSIPAAGNTWVVPDSIRGSLYDLRTAWPVALPETCTVHFHIKELETTGTGYVI